MDTKGNDKKKESANSAETKKQNQDFQNIPSSSEKTNPPDIEKEEIQKSSKNNKSGKTDNTEK